MPRSLRLQLGNFLKKERGELTYAQFSRRIGISKSTLQRLEQGDQNVTLDTLEHLLGRLRKGLRDIFPDS